MAGSGTTHRRGRRLPRGTTQWQAGWAAEVKRTGLRDDKEEHCDYSPRLWYRLHDYRPGDWGALTGALGGAFLDLAPEVQVTYLALEYGTRPILDVLTALRADHWLHAVPDRQTQLRDQIERQVRDAFYMDTPAWKAAVYGRAADFVLR